MSVIQSLNGSGMKVLIAVKRVVDYNIKVRPKADGSAVQLANCKMAINPFCEIAVEEAVRLKEQGIASELVAVSIGDKQSQEQLRSAMAMGVDRGILVETDQMVEPLAVAKCLQAIVDNEQPAIVLMGKQSIDGDNNQTGQMLGALTGYAQGTFVSDIRLDGKHLEITREVDGGLQTLQLSLPAIVTTDLRLNEPRYASLPNIMKAKRKPLTKLTPSELGVDIWPRLQTLSVEMPQQRQTGVRVNSVTELLDKLRNEAKVL